MSHKLPEVQTLELADSKIFDVRVFTPEGVLVDTIDRARLQRRYWRQFYAGVSYTEFDLTAKAEQTGY